jgi:hypothetical protein
MGEQREEESVEIKREDVLVTCRRVNEVFQLEICTEVYYNRGRVRRNHPN